MRTKRLILLLLVLACALPARAQYLSLGAGVGTDGISVELGARLGGHLQLRTGYGFATGLVGATINGISVPEHPGDPSGKQVATPMTVKLGMNEGRVLFDIFPGSSDFHISVGAHMGSPRVARGILKGLPADYNTAGLIVDGYLVKATGGVLEAALCGKGLGQYNSLYEQMLINGTAYSTERYRLSDESLWPRTTDNFWQSHHLLSFAWEISPAWDFSAVGHYTHGYGYYEEFRYANKLVKYGIDPFVDQAGDKVKRSDFVRQKGLDQDCFGVVANLKYHHGRLNAIAGISAQQFLGKHFGYLVYASNEELAERLFAENGNYRYYDSDAAKFDGNAFLKATFRLAPSLSAFGDLQYRRVHFRTGGYNDKYIERKDGSVEKHILDIDEHWDFFNPKAGLNFSYGPHRLYASAAMSHREPERNNFTDNGKYPAPRAERLLDYEGGYQLAGRVFRAGANFYYMRYKDQLVQTGEKSDIGEALTTNIPDSYRTGVELTMGLDITKWLSLEGNAALSRNRLLDFDEYVEDWDDWEGNPDAAKYHCDGNGDELRVFHYDDKALAFSPDAILNGFVDLHAGGFQATWHTAYVSRMYLDNSENLDRSLPAYTLSGVSLGYTVKPKGFLREIRFGIDCNNVFSARVAQSGWVYSAICESYGHTDDNRYYQIGFVPVAPMTVIGSITLRI